MSLPVRYRSSALKDSAKRARYYARIDADLARRFLDSLADTVTSIASQPALGSPWNSIRRKGSSIRYRPVIGFQSVLVFYRELQSELIISRVLHSKQNIAKILGSGRTN